MREKSTSLLVTRKSPHLLIDVSVMEGIGTKPNTATLVSIFMLASVSKESAAVNGAALRFPMTSVRATTRLTLKLPVEALCVEGTRRGGDAGENGKGDER
jgi:hypothetical protein